MSIEEFLIEFEKSEKEREERNKLIKNWFWVVFICKVSGSFDIPLCEIDEFDPLQTYQKKGINYLETKSRHKIYYGCDSLVAFEKEEEAKEFYNYLNLENKSKQIEQKKKEIEQKKKEIEQLISEFEITEEIKINFNRYKKLKGVLVQ